jgi:hypothetical protein
MEKFISDLTIQSANIVYLWCKTKRFQEVSYGWTVLSRTKFKCVFEYPVIEVQKGLYKKCNSWSHFHRSRKPKFILTPCCQKVSNITSKLD